MPCYVHWLTGCCVCMCARALHLISEELTFWWQIVAHNELTASFQFIAVFIDSINSFASVFGLRLYVYIGFFLFAARSFYLVILKSNFGFIFSPVLYLFADLAMKFNLGVAARRKAIRWNIHGRILILDICSIDYIILNDFFKHCKIFPEKNPKWNSQNYIYSEKKCKSIPMTAIWIDRKAIFLIFNTLNVKLIFIHLIFTRLELDFFIAQMQLSHSLHPERPR